jgi:biopolymer transport protein ExbD
MAEINSSGAGKRKKASTKVDMTPMVDLAFLLITFFMLTTTFGKPQAMLVNMPDKTSDNQQQALKESKALTILLGEGDKVFYFQGLQNQDLIATDYSAKGIRDVLLQKNKEVDGLVVLIKAHAKARYKNMVDMLDEMHITNTQRYAIVDMTDDDLAKLEETLKGGIQ